jgi:glycosyltransferase involved in cell wall biosynthesis
MDELITICIPTFRRPSMLLHCLHSCLTQDYRPLEIDISDNSPDDTTGALVASVTPPAGVTIRYWRNQPAIGPIDNQRKLFAAVRGRRFVYMNDDDVLLPGAVRAMAGAFALAPDVVIAFGREQIINPAGEELPEASRHANAECGRVAAWAGLHRDLLVAAFRGQISHIGFLVLTEAARAVGIRDRAEVGLAGDTDFAIRLGQTYRGAAYVFVDRAIFATRLAAASLSRMEADVGWKLYREVAALTDLSAEEAQARDQLLRRIAPLALREHCLARRRRDALKVLLARTYPHDRGLLRSAYAASLLAMPRLAYALRRLAGDPLHRTG